MIDAKNAILITAVLAIVAIVGLYIPFVQYEERQGSGAIPAGMGESPLTRVVYTNRGFEPATITIAVGATLEWVNESDKPLWIASDPHPSHSDLPGFDEGGVEGNEVPQSFLPVAYAHSQGSFYRYTFLKLGTWGYHNHLVPSDRGIVIVE